MFNRNNDYLRGSLAVAGAATLWGTNATVSKALFNLKLDPLRLLEIRLVLAAGILLLVLLLFRRDLLHINRADWPYFLVLGIVGLAMVQLTYLYTISLTGVALAVFLQYLAPIFVSVYTMLATRRWLAGRRLFGIGVAILGSALLVLPGAGGQLSLPGLLSGVGSAVFLAFYTIWVKRKADVYSGWTILVYGMSIAAVAWSLIVPPWRAFSLSYSSSMQLAFLYIAVFSTIIPFGLYFLGLRFIDPTTATVTAMLEPVIAAGTAFLFLKERLLPLQLAGAVSILLAVLLTQRRTLAHMATEKEK